MWKLYPAISFILSLNILGILPPILPTTLLFCFWLIFAIIFFGHDINLFCYQDFFIS